MKQAGRQAGRQEKSMLKTAVDVFPDSEVLLCPVCGFEYVHPLKVKVATENYVVAVDSKGLRVIQGQTAETTEAGQERGIRIILEYRCEEGHHGNLLLQFHKGNTFVLHENLPLEDDLETLWRS